VGHGRHRRQVLRVRVGEPEPRPHYVDALGIRAGRTFAPTSRTKATTRTAGGDLSIIFPQKLGGFFLDLMVSPTITPVVATGSAYNSTFLIGSSTPTKSATLQVNKPTTAGVDTAFTYPGRCSCPRRSRWRSAVCCPRRSRGRARTRRRSATTPAGAALATASYVAGNDVWPHTEMRSPTRARRCRSRR
jgi:hypothetical protein